MRSRSSFCILQSLLFEFPELIPQVEKCLPASVTWQNSYLLKKYFPGKSERDSKCRVAERREQGEVGEVAILLIHFNLDFQLLFWTWNYVPERLCSRKLVRCEWSVYGQTRPRLCGQESDISLSHKDPVEGEGLWKSFDFSVCGRNMIIRLKPTLYFGLGCYGSGRNSKNLFFQ